MIPKNLQDLVTFVPNKTEPIHNWFYYKEGYSRKFVEWAVKEFELEEPICDPFCGVGTTLLACKQMGLESIGFDSSPLAAFVSEAKTRDYEMGELEKVLVEFRELKPKQVGKFANKNIRRLFREKQLDDIYFYYKEIDKIKDSRVRAFFLLALIDTTSRVANVVKVGGSLRKQKKPAIPVKKLFLGKVKKMLLDLKHASQGPEPEVFEADARMTKLKENSVGAVITSPPYLNKIEYTSVYKMELGLFFRGQETRLRAHIQDKATGRDFGSRMPLVAKAYFDDMRKVLENAFRYLRAGGKAVIVIGGGCFPYETVEADDELIKIAAKIGFRKKDKIVARKVLCMRNRTIKVGTVRESVLVLEKPTKIKSGGGAAEYLDIVNESDEVTGRDTRENVHKNHQIHRGIHVLILNSGGDVLVQKRSMKKADRPGYYDASVGGQVSSGEPYEQSAKRETEEELGFVPLKLEWVCDYNAYSKRQKEKRRLFTCYSDGPFEIDKEEVESVEFWPVEKIQKEIEKGEKKFTDGFKISFSKYLENKKG